MVTPNYLLTLEINNLHNIFFKFGFMAGFCGFGALNPFQIKYINLVGIHVYVKTNACVTNITKGSLTFFITYRKSSLKSLQNCVITT